MVEISDNVRELIRRRVTSMDHVEVLMRLYESDGQPLTLKQIERAARLGPQTVARCVTDLVNSRLASHDPAAGTYGYDPRDPDRATIDELWMLYHQRPVTLVKLVYAQPSSSVRSFADSFRLRDDDREPGPEGIS